MNPLASIKRRLLQGYGLIITDWGPVKDPKTPKHWCLSLNFNKNNIIHIYKSELFNEARKKLELVLRKIEARETFLLISEYKEEEIFRHSESELNKLTIEKCCFFDFHKFICEGDVYYFKYTLKPDHYGEIPLTPIEKKLADAMDKAHLRYDTQLALVADGKNFRPDFLVYEGNNRIIVEADGIRYHIPEKDKVRDEAILNSHSLETIRFGGSKILYEPEKCVEEIRSKLGKINKNVIDFNYEDKELIDDAQWNAINHDIGSSRVVAPAGSGKTKVLINRVINLVNSGVDPSGILCLAFNRDAALQMSNRLSNLSINVRSPQSKIQSAVTVATFNSLGLSILKSLGVSNEPLNKKPLQDLLKRILNESDIQLPILRNIHHWEVLLNGLSRIKRGLHDPSEEEIEFRISDSENRAFPIIEFFNLFEKKCAEKMQVTFDGQIYSALILLLSNFHERYKIQNKFSHIIVDEYQDLNSAQIALVRLLSSRGQEVFVVGDDDQLIYSWREVDDSNILDFGQMFQNMKNYPLSTNYRSAKTIVRTSQRLIKYNVRRVQKNIEPHDSNPEGKAKVFCADAISGQLKWIIELIKKHKQKDPKKNKSIAILTRHNLPQILVAHALDKAGIPRHPLDHRIGLYSSPAGFILRSYLKIISNPIASEPLDIKRSLSRPNRYLKNEFLDLIEKEKEPWLFLKAIIELEQKIKLNKDNNIKPFVEYGNKKLINLPKSLGEKWRSNELIKFLLDIEFLNKEFLKQPPSEFISILLKKCDFKLKKDKFVTDEEEITDNQIIDLIWEDSKQFKSTSEFLEHFEKQIMIEDQTISDDTQQKENKIDKENDKNKVRISTIHRAKGKEWEIVFLFDVHDKDGVASGQISKKIIGPSEEERRVMYVGFTRARSFLYVAGRQYPLSNYLKEAFVPKSLLAQKDPVGYLSKEIASIKSEIQNTHKKIKNINKEEDQIPSLKKDLNKYDDEIKLIKAKIEELMNTETQGILGKIFGYGMSTKEFEYKVDFRKDELIRQEVLKEKCLEMIEEIQSKDRSKLIYNLEEEISNLENKHYRYSEILLNIKHLFSVGIKTNFQSNNQASTTVNVNHNIQNNIIKPSKQNNLDKKTESSFEDKLKKLRKVHRNAYNPWTSQEEDILVKLWKETDDLKAISEKLGRQIGGVRSRLIKLGHLEK